MCVCACACACACVRACVHARVRVRVCVRVCMCVHVCVCHIYVIPRDDMGVRERSSTSRRYGRSRSSTAQRRVRACGLTRLRSRSWRGRGWVLAQTWLGPGADVAGSWHGRGSPRYLRRAADAGDENACLEVLARAATAGLAHGGVPREHREQYDCSAFRESRRALGHAVCRD